MDSSASAKITRCRVEVNKTRRRSFPPTEVWNWFQIIQIVMEQRNDYGKEDIIMDTDLTLNSDFYYPIDWDEVETLDDIIKILKELEIVIGEHANNFEELKPYLKIDDE